MIHYRLLAAAMLVAASPLAAQSFDPSEPVAVAGSVDQGIDFVYVDPALRGAGFQQQRPQQRQGNWMLRSVGYDWGPQQQRASAPNPLFLQLSEGLEQYRASWGRLPQLFIPVGAPLNLGDGDHRVELLRQRLGLQGGFGFDAELADRVRDYQRVHGLKASGIADTATIRSLNQGSDYYVRKIALNLERARRLPQMGQFERYVIVDSGAAQVYMLEGDRVADSMRAIVGSAENKTPMMAVVMQGATVNPYWNVPRDLIQTMTARKVLAQGTSYLKNYNYEVLSNGIGTGTPIDPRSVDWNAVAAGTSDIHVRQLPGPGNSMGAIKFNTPNQYGIFLHDTPGKDLFAKADRWVSNGCVRLQDANRFASWVFGEMPQREGRETMVNAPRPVPVYMTYLTVEPDGGGVKFRADPYAFDDRAMQRMFGNQQQMASIGGN